MLTTKADAPGDLDLSEAETLPNRPNLVGR
jgi:hypothetical protein